MATGPLEIADARRRLIARAVAAVGVMAPRAVSVHLAQGLVWDPPSEAVDPETQLSGETCIGLRSRSEPADRLAQMFATRT